MSDSTPNNDFRIFVQKIAMQGFYSLGIIEIPGAPKQEQANLPACRMVIEDLDLLRDRTQGNLTEGEQLTLDKFLGDLRMAYVQRNGETAPSEEAAPAEE